MLSLRPNSLRGSSCTGTPAEWARQHPRPKTLNPGPEAYSCAAVDTASDPRAPSLAAIVEAKDVAQSGLSWLHSAHCLGSGEIMISTMVCACPPWPGALLLARRACLGTSGRHLQQGAERRCTPSVHPLERHRARSSVGVPGCAWFLFGARAASIYREPWASRP